MLSNKFFIQPHSGEILVDVDTAKFKRGVAPTYFINITFRCRRSAPILIKKRLFYQYFTATRLLLSLKIRSKFKIIYSILDGYDILSHLS